MANEISNKKKGDRFNLLIIINLNQHFQILNFSFNTFFETSRMLVLFIK